MEDTTRTKAFNRLLQSKPKKAELQTLIEWADSEIEEWQLFRDVCKTRLLELKK
jgi:hypothetical protein